MSTSMRALRLRLWLLIVLATGCAAEHGVRRPPHHAPVPAMLTGIRVDAERDPSVGRAYDRKQWHHWIDADGDCQNTRQEVLIRMGDDIVFTSPKHCTVKSGVWHDPYTGKTFTNPADLDIDHVVPLKDAFVSGGYVWDHERREAFANDLRYDHHLLAVEDNANQEKSDHSPDEWMPPNAAYACEYVTAWVRIKKTWDLSMTRPEFEKAAAVLAACP